MVAKSPWDPAIRREHALATQAGAHGVGVHFIEAPSDVRRLRRPGRRSWAAGLRSTRPGPGVPGVITHRRSTLVPGHRGPLAATVDNALLRRSVRALCGGPAPADVAVVVNVPWQWDATASSGARRVFDAADDWNLLLAGRRPHVRTLYARIAAEADAVVVANEHLAALFPGRAVHVVPNGTPSDLVAGSAARRGGTRRMVYVGTLSERFDADLVTRLLTLLPDWSLDLYGECRYAGSGTLPAPELRALLDRFGDRVAWHGVLRRAEMGEVLNHAGVALVPHRPQYCRGQSSMKFLDYAARGCPVVSTRWETQLERQAPPGVWFADTAADFADAVRAADDIDAPTSNRAIDWARAQTWERRWPQWAAAVFGTAPQTN